MKPESNHFLNRWRTQYSQARTENTPCQNLDPLLMLLQIHSVKLCQILKNRIPLIVFL